MSVIYLASPYSHPDAAVRQRRFEEVCGVAARLMLEGKHVFSPIAHTHPIALAGDLPEDFAYWEAFDRKMIAACSEMWVVMMDGWSESRGIKAELDIAASMWKPVRYLMADGGAA